MLRSFTVRMAWTEARADSRDVVGGTRGKRSLTSGIPGMEVVVRGGCRTEEGASRRKTSLKVSS